MTEDKEYRQFMRLLICLAIAGAVVWPLAVVGAVTVVRWLI